MMENLSDSPTIDETLVQLGVENETSIATLISALKGILSKVKKIPGGRDYAFEICERVQFIYHQLLEENANLLRNENVNLQNIIKLQQKLENKDTVAPPSSVNCRPYSSVVKGPETFSIILEPSSNEGIDHIKKRRDPPAKIVQDISKIIRRDISKFSAKKIIQGREGKIIVELTSKQDLNNALCVFNENSAALKYTPREVKKRLPRMLVSGTPSFKSKSECKEFIGQSNSDLINLVTTGETLEVVTIVEKGKSCSVILEMSPKIRAEILKRGGLNFGFLRLYCEDYINLIRCTNCCLFGHKKSECRGDLTCSWCMGDHNYNDCTKSFTSRPCCRSCYKGQVKSEPHPSYDYKNCPIAREITDQLKKNIDYTI